MHTSCSREVKHVERRYILVRTLDYLGELITSKIFDEDHYEKYLEHVQRHVLNGMPWQVEELSPL